ncbi:MAG TPA: DapH/DapD/GlmU-related protein [bacterium]|nr:DapH/DapD/GlmU-related protein [bacterium]
MKFREVLNLVESDIRFYSHGGGKRSMIGNILFDASLQLVILYRIAHYFQHKRKPAIAKICEWLQIILIGCYINSKAEIGRNFKIAHPVGIVIGDGVKIGNNVTIWQNVTIGSSGRAKELPSYPTIEDNVRIFANAVVVGGVKIGRNSVIGALSFINKDVPADSVALTDRIFPQKRERQ